MPIMLIDYSTVLFLFLNNSIFSRVTIAYLPSFGKSCKNLQGTRSLVTRISAKDKYELSIFYSVVFNPVILLYQARKKYCR